MLEIFSFNGASSTRCAPIFIGLMLLSACAVGPYDPINDADYHSTELGQVRADPETYIGMPVRWGGNIARIENRTDETLIEIVEHKLYSNGRPQNTNLSDGRFVARISGFLDPAIYAAGRQITVVGTLAAMLQRDIGQHPYSFPVVSAHKYELWEERKEPDVVFYPFFYGGYGNFGFHTGFPYHYRGFRHHRYD